MRYISSHGGNLLSLAIPGSGLYAAFRFSAR
jgi:hypothetical protein